MRHTARRSRAAAGDGRRSRRSTVRAGAAAPLGSRYRVESDRPAHERCATYDRHARRPLPLKYNRGWEVIMHWQRVGRRLESCFQPIVDMVRSTYPELHAGHGWSAPVGVVKFQATATFCYDPAYAEFEDLVLMYTCAPADRSFSDGGRVPFHGVAGRDGVKFEIERGTGLVLAALDPVLLPGNDESGEYGEAVLQYADRACAFVNASTDLILDALRTPYRA